jgi:hypothetical protein
VQWRITYFTYSTYSGLRLLAPSRLPVWLKIQRDRRKIAPGAGVPVSVGDQEGSRNEQDRGKELRHQAGAAARLCQDRRRDGEAFSALRARCAD